MFLRRTVSSGVWGDFSFCAAAAARKGAVIRVNQTSEPAVWKNNTVSKSCPKKTVWKRDWGEKSQILGENCLGSSSIYFHIRC